MTATAAPPLEMYATDFGHLKGGQPLAVARPGSTAELQALVRTAYRQGTKLTPRGMGLSQGGQSIADGSVALDLSMLARVGDPDPAQRTVECEAGATWRALVDRCAPLGLLPAVLPANLDLTVGGVLSVGGVGSTSHLHGPVVSNAIHLQLVTGTGDCLPGDPREHPQIAAAALGGLGRCGVIASVNLRLRPIRPRIRSFQLLYDDPRQWFDDQQRLLGRDRPPDSMEGFTSLAAQGLRNTPDGRRPFGVWFYGLTFSYEYGSGPSEPPPAPESALADLRPYRLVNVEDDDTRTFQDRYQPRFRAMRRLGAWDQPHPWVEAFLDLPAARASLPDLLAGLPPSLGDGQRLMFVADGDLPGLFAVPAGRPLVVFALLPVGSHPALAADDQQAMRGVHQRLLDAGGKRYLSGWLEAMGEPGWRAHFGPAFPAWQALKRQLDPGGVFCSLLLPAADSPTDDVRPQTSLPAGALG
jgi:cytokinin dehydrogenase